MIRGFRDSDMEDVLRIWLDASVGAHDFVDRDFWQSKINDMENAYIPASETYVYEDEGAITGFLSLCDNTLAALFVAPEYQGKGIGRKLIEKAKELRQGLELSVYKANERAVRFYEMCGFTCGAERVDARTGHPELVMVFGS